MARHGSLNAHAFRCMLGSSLEILWIMTCGRISLYLSSPLSVSADRTRHLVHRTHLRRFQPFRSVLVLRPVAATEENSSRLSSRKTISIVRQSSTNPPNQPTGCDNRTEVAVSEDRLSRHRIESRMQTGFLSYPWKEQSYNP